MSLGALQEGRDCGRSRLLPCGQRHSFSTISFSIVLLAAVINHLKSLHSCYVTIVLASEHFVRDVLHHRHLRR